MTKTHTAHLGVVHELGDGDAERRLAQQPEPRDHAERGDALVSLGLREPDRHVDERVRAQRLVL